MFVGHWEEGTKLIGGVVVEVGNSGGGGGWGVWWG